MLNEATTEQLALFMNARDQAESGTVSWDSLGPDGREAYLKDAHAIVSAFVTLGWTPPPTDDPLATPLDLPPVTLEDGSLAWPGDPRFAVRVRTVYGSMPEQIVEASSLVDALTKAAAIPLTEWIERRARPAPLCPECRDGKHRNCIGEALAADDTLVPCGCPNHEETPCAS